MSTILKALRRLEDDDPKKKRAGGGTAPSPRDAVPSPGFPATDPRAADALRGRILAEEAAAHAVRSLSIESTENARNRRPRRLRARWSPSRLPSRPLLLPLPLPLPIPLPIPLSTPLPLPLSHRSPHRSPRPRKRRAWHPPRHRLR